MMISRSNRRLAVRLRQVAWQILIRVALPQRGGSRDSAGRELVLVASPTPPYLRRLTVYHGRNRLEPQPFDPPRAA